MEKETLITRRNFVGWGAGIMAVLSSMSLLLARNREKKKKPVKMLTRDGKLVEVDIKHVQSKVRKGGEGDGTKAAELKTSPGDFTTKEFQAETDGDLFYKSSEGRDDMPSFKKKIPESEDLWAVVNYIRTMRAK